MPQPAGIDVRLVRSTLAPEVMDWQLDENGDIATLDSFDTALWVSLFTDARATPDQVAVPELRRGWHGNERTPGFQMGGHLWLFRQNRLDARTANGMADAADGALQWMVDGGFALSVRSTVTFLSSTKALLKILITRPTGETETKQFLLWENTAQVFGEAV